jgi:hypothetical protein
MKSRGAQLVIQLITIAVMTTIMLGFSGCGDDDSTDEGSEQADKENSEPIQQEFEVTVSGILYPYTAADPNEIPEAGYQFVIASVTVKNTGEFAVVASYADFSLEASDGEKYQAIPVSGLGQDFGAGRSPQPGSSETGSLLFAIPASAVPVSLWEEIGPEERKVALPA